jgi:hypothetical protein
MKNTQRLNLNRSAAQEVAERLATARALLVELAEHVDQIESDASKQPRHWGFAGDLGHIAEQLRNALGIGE